MLQILFKDESTAIHMVGEELLHSIRTRVWIRHYSHIKPGAVVCTYNLNTKEAEADRSLDLTGKTLYEGNSSVRDPVLKNELKRAWERKLSEVILSSLN